MCVQDIFLLANNALAEGNYEAFISYCTEDIKWDNVGESTFNGKAELLSYISSAYTGITFKTEISIEENDTIVELGKLVTEQNGETREASYCDVWRFKDGKIGQLTSFCHCDKFINKLSVQNPGPDPGFAAL